MKIWVPQVRIFGPVMLANPTGRGCVKVSWSEQPNALMERVLVGLIAYSETTPHPPLGRPDPLPQQQGNCMNIFCR